MSSNPRRSRSAFSLRTRLLAGQVLLLAAVCVGIGAATEVALYRYLVGQLDTQLHEVAHRSAVIHGEPPPPPPPGRRDVRPFPRPGPGPDFLDAPGQPVGVVAAVLDDTRHLRDAGFLTGTGERAAVDDTAVEQLSRVPVGTEPTTLSLDGMGRYRVLAVPARHGGDTVITGLPLAGVDATAIRVLLIFAVVTAAALAVATTAGLLLIRRALAPLNRVAQTAGEVVNLPLDRGEVALPVRVGEPDTDTRTEVGRLGSAVNRMLDHIAAALTSRQASETRVRQFVADASHELRTPLTAIRGYTELARRLQPGTTAVPEVSHALSRVSSETERMTRLVEDLLLLARLDSGRPLQRAPVDLSRLAVDAVRDAHIAGPDHEWKLDLPAEPVVVPGDEERLRQVLTNLLGNARIHTAAGTTVTTRLAADGEYTVLQVADDGPGIPAALGAEVFERFARGDTSRSRRGGSTGLGLAIAAAIVKAHGGTITVDSVPGQTRFSVRLARRGAPSDGDR
ncbi:HAMP domain-containing histidine kinase [Mycolicibacillus parakoreensis]|uniref:histidine kinase n=1 Tax=Mycolicibacillus parakoreensis TaxID=1069221 RepID=A0ABY3U6L4_9MYCO|nr:HAMP domain-containing sensor histidine kinase [Mycolicibacillus parakoreensis]MCV7314633.1 HAMP domain-containing histidine kinase [Mycolicibacillus parakoreensis]ULN53049.1 HAMP domain-containing histidine kinase [Mycolicibacillus parakoreensis]HLS00190.1 HAMP domain-containing sensor histidine kinase [Mycolicibacillus parakoreensis]